MKRLLPFSGLIIALLFGCTNDEPVKDSDRFPEENPITERRTTCHLTLDEVLNDYFTGQGGKATRSSIMDKIDKVEYLIEEGAATRSDSPFESDTLFYAVNFKDDGGFLLLAADLRATPIYGRSDTGSFHLEDFKNDEGKQFVLNMFKESMKYEIEHYEEWKENFTPATRGINPIDTKNLVGPLIKVQWSQNAPYNKYLYTSNGQKAIAGCTTVAIAQMMSYWQYPIQSYVYKPNTRVNWHEFLKVKNYSYESVSPTGAEHIAWLYYDIVKDAKINLGISDSGGWPQDFPWTKYGYSSGGRISTKMETYGYLKSEKKPVIVVGWTSYDSSKKGHTWVVDGFAGDIVARRVCERDKDGWDCYYDIEEIPELHCNWGWSGLHDGWYYYYTPDKNYNNLLTHIVGIQK